MSHSTSHLYPLSTVLANWSETFHPSFLEANSYVPDNFKMKGSMIESILNYFLTIINHQPVLCQIVIRLRQSEGLFYKHSHFNNSGWYSKKSLKLIHASIIWARKRPEKSTFWYCLTFKFHDFLKKYGNFKWTISNGLILPNAWVSLGRVCYQQG